MWKMTAPEMSLDQAIQISRMQAEELETKDNQLRHIKTVFDEREQRLLDTYNKSSGSQERAEALCKLEELRDTRKEIDIILGSEG